MTTTRTTHTTRTREIPFGQAARSRRFRSAVLVGVLGLAIAAPSVDAGGVPPVEACAIGQVPVAVDFGGLAAPNVTHDQAAIDALLGTTAVGTDCGLFDLPPGI